MHGNFGNSQHGDRQAKLSQTPEHRGERPPIIGFALLNSVKRSELLQLVSSESKCHPSRDTLKATLRPVIDQLEGREAIAVLFRSSSDLLWRLRTFEIKTPLADLCVPWSLRPRRRAAAATCGHGCCELPAILSDCDFFLWPTKRKTCDFCAEWLRARSRPLGSLRFCDASFMSLSSRQLIYWVFQCVRCAVCLRDTFKQGLDGCTIPFRDEEALVPWYQQELSLHVTFT